MKNYFKSLISLAFSLLVTCISYSQCDYFINMQDSYGDGWNGASIDVAVNGTIVSNLTISNGYNDSGYVSTYTNDVVEFTFNSGSWDSEITFQITDPAGNSLGSFGTNPTIGLFLTHTSNSTCAPPSCMAPSGFIASNISASSADISWTGAINANSFTIEYGASGFALGSGTTINATTTNYTVTGLNPSSSYDVYLQADCGAGDTSSIAGPFTFATSIQGAGNITCTTGFPGAAFVDDLEVQGIWTGDFGTGNGVWKVNSGGTSSLNTGPSGAHSGNSYFYFETSTGGGTTGTIVTPVIDLTSASNDAELSFWVHAFGATMGTLDVGVGTSASGPFTNIFSQSGQLQTSSADPFQNVGVNIANYIGQQIYVSFTYTRGSSFTGDIAIDLVEVLSCFNCPGPSNLQAFNLTGFSGDVSWTASGAANDWNIWYHPQGSPMGTPTLVTNDTVSLTGLSPVTTYEFYVQANCTGDSSIIVGPLFFTTPCAALLPPQLEDFSAGYPPNNCWDEASTGDPGTGPSTFGTGSWIQDGFANIGNTGAVKIYLYGNSQSDWILSPQYDLSAGGPYQVEFDFGVFNVGSSSPGTLGSDDRVELLISDNGGFSWQPLSSWSGTYVTSPNGNHEIVSLSSFSGIVEFAFWGTDGIVDDPEANDVMVDNFQVRTIPSCPQPLSLQVSNVTGDSATATWTAGGSETLWNVQWGLSGFNPGSGLGDTTSVTNFIMTPLSPSTAYDVYVQAICAGGDSSSWTGPYTYNTPIQGPQGITCSTGNPGVVLSDDLESQASWTGDFTSTGLGWRMNSGTTSSTGTGPSGAHSGSNYFYFECTGGGNSSGTIVSPMVDLAFGADDAELSFWVHAYGATIGTLDVGVGTSPAGPFNTIFTNTGQLQSNNSDPYQNVGINLGSYIGQQVYLAFTYTKGSSFTGDIAIDLVEVTSCLSCAAPSNITLNNLSADTANISWTTNSSDSLWLVYLSPNNTPVSNITPFTANNDTIDIVVNPSTTYNVYIQSICSSGDSSILAGPLNFVTPCTYTIAPYFTSFDFGFPLCWTQGSADIFDWTLDANGTTSSSTGPSDDLSGGGNYMYIETSSPRTQGDFAILHSPNIDLSALTVPELRFYSHMYGQTIDSLVIDITDDGGLTYNNIFNKFGDQGDVWNEELVILSNYSGIVSFRITGYVGSSFTGDIAIDNFEVREAPTCPQPLSLNAINLFADSVDLTWTAGLNETEWYVYLVPDTSTLASTSPILVYNDTASFAINPNTTYSFYVQGICGPADSSLLSGPYTFSSPCVAITSLPYLEDMSTWPPNCWDLTGGTQTCIHYNGTAVEASYWSWPNGNNALMTSPIFDVSSLISPELIFDWSHTYNTFYPNDALEVLVSDDGGTTWNQIWYKAGADLESNDGASTQSPGSFVSSGRINLSIYGNNIMIRFNFASGYGPDCFIDNVQILEAPANDIGVFLAEMPSASTGCTMDSSLAIVTINNYGTANQVNFDVMYDLNGNIVTETIGDTLFGGSSLTYTFSDHVDFTNDGSYTLMFSTSLPSDSDTSNDMFGTMHYENKYTPASPTTTGDTVCGVSGVATLTGNASSGSTLDWFDDPNGNNLIHTGDTLVTPVINTTTSYWAAYQEMAPGYVGPSDYFFGGGGSVSTYNKGLVFDVFSSITIDSVTVYPSDTGNIDVQIIDVLGSSYYSNSISISGPIPANGAVTIPIGASLQPSFGYSILASSSTVNSGLYRNDNGAAYPYDYGSAMSITGASDSQAGYYYFFYNWSISSISCYSDLVETVATVEPCASIEEKTEFDFEIYPNPNQGEFTLNTMKTNGEISIEISDINGKLIYNKTRNGLDNKLQISNIERGVYFIKVSSNNDRVVKRFVVQ